MTFRNLPSVAWLAIAFAVVLCTAIACVHLFEVPPYLFMAPLCWWLDIAGLAAASLTWFVRALRRQPASKLA